MRNKALLLTIALLLGNYVIAQVHTYLDRTKNIEERVEDALSRMTLTEKLKVIHAQSKFSSAGVPRLGFPDFWTSDGPHGIRKQNTAGDHLGFLCGLPCTYLFGRNMESGSGLSFWQEPWRGSTLSRKGYGLRPRR